MFCIRARALVGPLKHNKDEGFSPCVLSVVRGERQSSREPLFCSSLPQVTLYRLRENSCFVSGHGFSRAVKAQQR
jgi:hypothetical protein